MFSREHVAQWTGHFDSRAEGMGEGVQFKPDDHLYKYRAFLNATPGALFRKSML